MHKWLRSPIFALLAVSTLYIGILLWADRQQGLAQGVGIALSHAPYLLLATVVSYLFRFYRWWWLLNRVGYSFPIGRGVLSYLAGFAYTATPGKVGELIRIRYFSRLNVPGECAFGAFVMERSCDLVAVLLLSLFIVSNSEFLFVAAGFVLVIVGSVLACAWNPKVLEVLGRTFERWRIPLLPKLCSFLYIGIGYCYRWLNAKDLMMGLSTGLAAWAVVGLGFVYLQSHLTSGIPFHESLSLYPLSMLVGAASMIPGGVGSTESAMVILMGQYGITVGAALIVAVVIRISTLWFGILVGFCSLAFLELHWKYSLHKEGWGTD